MEELTNESGFENVPVTEVSEENSAEVLTETSSAGEEVETDACELTRDTQTNIPDESYYENLEREDVKELSIAFPEFSGTLSLSDLKNPVRYGALRDLGLSPIEAYLAVGGRKAPQSDNRSHLHSAVPRVMGGIGDTMTVGELSEARELFVGLSDSEIRRLYKKVKN